MNKAWTALSAYADRVGPGLQSQPICARWDPAAWLAATLATASVAAIAWISAGRVGLRVSELAVFFDGHIYLEIARSFPLPFEAGSLIYSGFAPAYPFLIYLLRLTGMDWGLAALVVGWLSTGAAAGFLSVLARELGLPRTGTVALYFIAYPYVLIVGAAAHAESLALATAIGAAVYALAGNRAVSATLLAACILSRFPALTLLPAFALLAWPSSMKGLVWLAPAPLSLGLWNLYLRWRVPGFRNIFQAHTFWKPEITLPFAAFLLHPVSPHVAWSLALLLAAIVAAALAPQLRGRWVWALWVAIFTGFHLSLSGEEGVSCFARLVILAWPAAVLLLSAVLPWRRVVPAACALSLVYVLPWVLNFVTVIPALQSAKWDFLADARARLESDEPVWITPAQFWWENRRSTGDAAVP